MDDIKKIVSVFFKDMRGTRKMAKQNNLPILASSVAFFSIFSLCPLLIISFLGSQYFLRRISAEGAAPVELTNLLNTLMPSVDSNVGQNLLTILKQNAITNLFNLALLVWSAYQLFDCLHTAFINISVRGNVRNAVWTNVVSVVSFFIVVGTSTLFLVLSTIDPMIIKKVFYEYLIGIDSQLVKAAATITASLLVLASVTFIYKLMPTQKVRLVHAFRGSLLFILLFICGRAAYELYAGYYRFMNEGTYGPFFTFIMVIVWIYYLSRIFLFSAQYAIFLEEKEA